MERTIGIPKENWIDDKLICCKCKQPKDPEDFIGDKRNKHRAFKSNICKPCDVKRKKDKVIEYNQTPNLNFYLTRLYASIKSRVKNNKSRSKNLLITKKDLFDLYEKQQGLCAISGIHMTYEVGTGGPGNHNSPNNISLDRIDSSKEYEEGNVQLVCSAVNFMKSNLTTRDLVSYCKKIVEYATKEKI